MENYFWKLKIWESFFRQTLTTFFCGTRWKRLTSEYCAVKEETNAWITVWQNATAFADRVFFCCCCCATSSSPPEQIQQQFAVCIISDDCVNGSVSRWFLLRLMPLLCCSVSFFTPLIFQIAVGESRTVNKQTSGQTSAHTPFIHNECTKWISGAQMNSMVELQTECMYALNMNINKHLPNGWLSTHSALDYTLLQ